MAASAAATTTHGAMFSWARLALRGGLLFICLFGGLELFWSALGYKPSVSDNEGLWALVRHRASGSPRVAALVGTSRVHAGLYPSVLASVESSLEWLQLGIDGTSPLPVLRDLAEDSQFSGLVICEFVPHYFFAPEGDGEERAEQFVANYHRSTWGDFLETRARVAAQSHWTIAREDANLIDFARRVWNQHGSLPELPGINLGDRTAMADFTNIDLTKAAENWVVSRLERKKHLAGRETTGRLPQLAAWARAIERRGGRVIFLRMPESGIVHEVEARLYPRADYWEPFVRSQTSVCLNSDDYLELSSIHSPDGSHLDRYSAPEFSRAIVRLLQRQGVLQPLHALR